MATQPSNANATKLRKKVEPNPPKYVWVDSVTSKSYSDNKWLDPDEFEEESNEEYQRRTWDSNKQSQLLWKKLNSGCLPATLELPKSAQKEHFQFDEDKLDPKKWDYHLVRNTYTDWINMNARLVSIERAMGRKG